MSSVGQRGTLLTADTSAILVIKMMNDIDPFIIRELDETHLLVDSSQVDWIKQSVVAFMEANVWTAEQSR